MKRGQIKFFNEEKGYGFLYSFEDGKDYFFHVSKVCPKDRDLFEPSSAVEFDLDEGRKGPEAVNVRLVEK
jgi:CspA family cold shock protein